MVRMSERSWARQHWKLLLNIVTLAALVLLVYLLRDQIVDTIHNLGHVNAWALLLLIPVQLLNYDAQTRMYRRLFAIVGNKLSYKSLFKTSLELNFVNHVFPSGGVSGISYFTLRLRDGDKISSGKATLVHIMKIALYFLAFEVILIFGVLCLAVMGQVNGLVILVAGSLSTLLFVGTGLFTYIIGSERRINVFFVTMTKALNRLIKVVRPSYPETINIDRARGVFNDFHDNYKAIKDNYRLLKMPFIYALIADATEIGSVYVVYIAFGEWVNIGAVILAYGIANFAGLVSVLPGGVGVYEVLMTTVLAAAGVPAALSLPVTVMYRVLNSAIQLPPGYYFYHQALKRGQKPAAGAG
jgi:putative heme transporter